MMKSKLYIPLLLVSFLALVSCTDSDKSEGAAMQSVEEFQYTIEVKEGMSEVEKWVVNQYNNLIAGVDSIEAIKSVGTEYDNALVSVISHRYKVVYDRIKIYNNLVDSTLRSDIFHNIDHRFRAFNDVLVGGTDSAYVKVYIAPSNAHFYQSGDCVDFNDFFGMYDVNTDWNHTELDDEMFQYLNDSFGVYYNNQGEYVIR